jgi:hypothetical protein
MWSVTSPGFGVHGFGRQFSAAGEALQRTPRALDRTSLPLVGALPGSGAWDVHCHAEPGR